MIKKMIKDSFPTIIALTLAGMYSVIDGIFIGRTTGDVGLAAINIAWPITAVITALGIGIGTGGSVLFSHYKGRNETENMQKAYSATLILLFITGVITMMVLFFSYQKILLLLGAKGAVLKEAVRYSKIIMFGSILQTTGAGILPVLRNKNKAVGAMCSMTMGLVVNIVLNYYFMVVCKMGIKGAAYGTVAAQGIVILLGMILLSGDTVKSFVWKLEWRLCRDIIKIGTSAFGVSLAPSITLIFTNWQCLRYGGEAAVACYAVISYIVFPVQAMLSGVGDGIQPLMSCMSGAGQDKEVQRIKKAARVFAVGLGGFAFIVTLIVSSKIGVWFGLSKAGSAYFKVGIVISACAFWIVGVVRLNITYLNATLQVKKAALLTYIESLAAAPVLLYLLPGFMGITGVWLSLPVTGVCMLGIYYLMEEKKK